MTVEKLHLFYEEPDPDRWLPYDRYPRAWIRRLVRGKPRPGGVMRWFLNLKAGLDELGVSYVVNDYRSLKKNSGAVALVIGKDHVLGKIPEGHPIVFGPGLASHPFGNSFWGKKDIRLLLISCDWFAKMYERDLPVKIPIQVWAAGIETELWKPLREKTKTGKILIYDKIRWERERYEKELLGPVRQIIKEKGFQPVEVRYLFYREEEYLKLLQEVDAMVFLCEHETQGFAYLQALSCDVPILAWDRGGFWKDPSYYPDKVKFTPVTSVPYWSPSCGDKFQNIEELSEKFNNFTKCLNKKKFSPRKYILENFKLKTKSRCYVNLVHTLQGMIREI